MKNKTVILVVLLTVILITTFALHHAHARNKAPHSAPPATTLSPGNTIPSTKPIDVAPQTTSDTSSGRKLSAEEQEEFHRELLYVFNKIAVTASRADTLRPLLQKLNERGRAGVAALVAELTQNQPREANILLRMSAVDYLKYRASWDSEVSADIRNIVLHPVAMELGDRERALVLADKAELVGGLARVDWEAAARLIDTITNPLLKDLSLYEAYHGLLAAGVGAEYALISVRERAAGFVP